MSAASTLVALAEEELRLVLDGRYEELDGIAERRALALRHLPPDAERSLVARAAAVQSLVTAALTERLAGVRAELVAGASRRAAVAGYARSAS